MTIADMQNDNDECKKSCRCLGCMRRTAIVTWAKAGGHTPRPTPSSGLTDVLAELIAHHAQPGHHADLMALSIRHLTVRGEELSMDQQAKDAGFPGISGTA